MAMAFSVEEEIRIVRNGQAIEAQYPIPPGVVGVISLRVRAGTCLADAQAGVGARISAKLTAVNFSVRTGDPV